MKFENKKLILKTGLAKFKVEGIDLEHLKY